MNARNGQDSSHEAQSFSELSAERIAQAEARTDTLEVEMTASYEKPSIRGATADREVSSSLRKQQRHPKTKAPFRTSRGGVGIIADSELKLHRRSIHRYQL